MGNFNILEHATILPMKERNLHFAVGGGRMGVLRAVKTDVQAFFLNGDGVEKPLGILCGYFSGGPAVHFMPRNEAGAICVDDLFTMLSLHAKDGQWLLSPMSYDQVAKFRYPCGTYLLEAEHGLLLGRPVHKCKESPELGEVGDVLLADFSAYAIGEYKVDGETWRDGMPTARGAMVGGEMKYYFVALGDALEAQDWKPLTWRERVVAFFKGAKQ